MTGNDWRDPSAEKLEKIWGTLSVHDMHTTPYAGLDLSVSKCVLPIRWTVHEVRRLAPGIPTLCDIGQSPTFHLRIIKHVAPHPSRLTSPHLALPGPASSEVHILVLIVAKSPILHRLRIDALRSAVRSELELDKWGLVFC